MCVSSVRQDLQTIGRGERSVTPVSGGQHYATPQGLQKTSLFSSTTPAGLGVMDSFFTGVCNPCLSSVSLAGTLVTVVVCMVACSASHPLLRGVRRSRGVCTPKGQGYAMRDSKCCKPVARLHPLLRGVGVCISKGDVAVMAWGIVFICRHVVRQRPLLRGVRRSRGVCKLRGWGMSCIKQPPNIIQI